MTGPRVVRIPRLETRVFEAEQKTPSRPLGTGALRIVIGFLLVLGLGAILLTLPFANANGDATTFHVALFTAVSAITVTGLYVVDTQTHYTFFGEAVILVLIQVGGLGYMLGVTTALWVFGRRVGLRDQHLLRQYYGSPSISEALQFAKRIAYYAITCEVIGAIVLFGLFVAAGVSPSTGVWWAIFHSVSAFNNAGFNITGADMVPFAEDSFVLLTLASLIIFGAVGALPIIAILQRVSLKRMPLDYLLIFLTSGALLVVGTGFFLVAEWSNPLTLGTVSPMQRFPLAFFQAASPRTAGFSAFDIANMEDQSLMLTIGLMFIGGASGSTAGGIKVGTFALLFFAMLATLRGEERIVAFRRELPPIVMRQALAIALLGVAVVFGTTTALTVFSNEPFLPLFFEAVSALATVGLSTGITPDHNIPARVVLMAAMLVGRFGPLLLVLAMNRQRAQRTTYMLPEQSVRLG